MPTLPEWWNWDLSFTGHAEMRMEQRGVSEVEVRAMLDKATAFVPSVVEADSRSTLNLQQPCLVIVEPDAAAKLLVVVTVCKVSE
jgi:hypothetical protein